MVKNRTIQVRMTKDQYERIKNNSRIKGFNSLSGFMRFAALDQELIIQQKIYEIHAHLLGDKPQPKFKQNRALPRGRAPLSS